MDSKCPAGVACDKDGYCTPHATRNLTRAKPWLCALMASFACADRATSTNGIDWVDDHTHNPVLGTDPPHSIGDVSSFVYDCTPHDIPASPLCIAS